MIVQQHTEQHALLINIFPVFRARSEFNIVHNATVRISRTTAQHKEELMELMNAKLTSTFRGVNIADLRMLRNYNDDNGLEATADSNEDASQKVTNSIVFFMASMGHEFMQTRRRFTMNHATLQLR